ncbi:hypothetical protein KX928_21590 [Roseobacter sp. YSTF-M11]|uniref:SnoaL-like domain-containing protein n=1 Tax=Roseobacter insulae TaxID=2859783 RepID=A0A9X1FZB4_9RHOB|nr:hypothetical protein [Roseobacter insulae]MBW4710392.1 hypothetical protein [Roseobacter insulae]
MTSAEALAIYQETLDALSDALMAGDTDTALARIKLPYLRRTLNSEVVIETPEDLVSGFLIYGEAVRGLGATNWVRLATEAAFLNDKYITGHHVTHTLRDATPVMESYASRMVLILEKGVWKMLEIHSMLSNPHWPIYIPRVEHSARSQTYVSSPQSDARKLAVAPLTLYQEFLDGLSAAHNADDFEAYCSYLLFPYTWHTESTDTIISSPDDVRPFFDEVRESIAARNGDRLVRYAEEAEFISGDLLCGYHATEFCSGARRVFGPVKSRMILKRKGTSWYLKSVTNSLENTKFPYIVPKPAKALVTLRTIQERTRT